MANLTIEMPDELVRSLEGIAAAQRESVQQLALEQLNSLVEVIRQLRAGSLAARNCIPRSFSRWVSQRTQCR
jgi:hypothetical protein